MIAEMMVLLVQDLRFSKIVPPQIILEMDSLLQMPVQQQIA